MAMTTSNSISVNPSEFASPFPREVLLDLIKLPSGLLQCKRGTLHAEPRLISIKSARFRPLTSIFSPKPGVLACAFHRTGRASPDSHPLLLIPVNTSVHFFAKALHPFQPPSTQISIRRERWQRNGCNHSVLLEAVKIHSFSTPWLHEFLSPT